MLAERTACIHRQQQTRRMVVQPDHEDAIGGECDEVEGEEPGDESRERRLARQTTTRPDASSRWPPLSRYSRHAGAFRTLDPCGY